MSATRSPLLSVGLPVYNGLPYLAETLHSVRDSEFDDYELIVCDNASTDGTGELVQDMALQDSRIRYVRNERNIGAARNYNKSFELAKGKYFRWLASDDLHTAGAVARCVEALERDPAVILAFPHTRLIDAWGAVSQDYDDGDGWGASRPSDRFGYSLTRWGLSNSMFGVIRSEVLRTSSLQGDYPASDLVMQSDLAIRGPFMRVSGEYYYRRIHDGCTDSLDALALAQFYDPDRDGPFDAKMLRVFHELTRLVRRAPVTPVECRRMWMLLAHRAWWNRSTLFQEARGRVRRAFRATSPQFATAIPPHWGIARSQDTNS